MGNMATAACVSPRSLATSFLLSLPFLLLIFLPVGSSSSPLPQLLSGSRALSPRAFVFPLDIAQPVSNRTSSLSSSSSSSSASSADVDLDLARRMYSGSPLRRKLADARMWLFGHVLTQGYYYTRLWLGTPPQKFALIVDTGSTVTYVPCGTCKHCGTHQDKPYSPTESSTFQNILCSSPECPTGQCGDQAVCSYNRHYAEESTSSGIIASDLAAFAPPPPADSASSPSVPSGSSIPPSRILFGCELTETGDLYTQRADGIVGMGRGPLGIMNQLVEQGAVEDQFSLCYGGMERGGGSMIVGAIDPPPEMAFTDFDESKDQGTYYNVVLKKILVDGKALAINEALFKTGYGSVLDSGTTFTYLPGPAFQAVRKAVDAAVKSKGMTDVSGPDPTYEDICWQGATDDLDKLYDFFPPVAIEFQGSVVYNLHAENYLFRHTKVKGAYCLGVFKSSGSEGGTLLGGILMRNTLVTYDRAKGHVGFFKTDCSKLFATLAAEKGQDPSTLPPELQTEPSDEEVEHGGGPTPQDNGSSAPTGSEEGAGEAGGGEPTPETQTSSACKGCAVRVVVAMHVSVTEDVFSSLKQDFVDDVARELSVETQQVVLKSYSTVQTTGANADTAAVQVEFEVVPAPPDVVLPGSAVERIQRVFSSGDMALRDTFGGVSVAKVEVIFPSESSPAPSSGSSWQGGSMFVVVLTVGVVAAAVAAVVVLVVLWRRRAAAAAAPKLNSTSQEQERREEKQSLAEQADEEAGDRGGGGTGDAGDGEHKVVVMRSDDPAAIAL